MLRVDFDDEKICMTREEEEMDEVALYNRDGRAIYRLCGAVFYDFQGKPRGFLVGKTVYDLRGQHRGFYVNRVVRDRMSKVIGFIEGAQVEELELPLTDIPPVPYKNLPAPEPPAGLVDRNCNGSPPIWSIMRLENLLV